MANYQDITIALAGVCQAATLVQHFAQKGSADSAVFEQSLKSLLVTQPENTLNVYGDQIAHLKTGLETALAQFGGGKDGKLDTEVGRYWISLLALSRLLDQNPQAKTELAQRLAQIERQLPLYDNQILNEQIISNFASIYSDIISPLGNRIQVFGKQDLLARPDIQARIRAALLAGIRAGVLWHQVGGTRWQLLLSRRKIFNTTKYFYQSIFGES